MEWVIVFFCAAKSDYDCIKFDNIQFPSSLETSISYGTEEDCTKNAKRIIRHYRNNLELGYLCVRSLKTESSGREM
jgi:hypothetical protein